MKKAPILTVAVFVAIAAIWLSFTAAGAQTASTDSPAKGDAPSVSDGSPTAGNRDGKTEADSDERPLAITAPELLQRARYRIHGYRSVKANLIETVVIGDRKFRANGTYLQGRDLQLKMSLKLRLGKDGEFRASMLQVCDGQVLWTSHTSGREVDKPDTVDGSEKKSGIERRITRRDVRQILREAARHNQQHQCLLFAELGVGGISELLGSLEHTMAFGKVRNEKIDGKPFLVVQGRWNIDVLKNFLDEQELDELRANADARQLPRLPEHMPDMVRLYFDRDSLFPRRVLYLKRPRSSNSLRSMLSLNFVDVVLNAPLDENAFNFVPPDKVFPLDVTPKYIQQIRDAANRADSRH
jgi:hypothetical protein